MLVATTNMDYVKDEDLYTIFKAKTKTDLTQKVKQAEELIKEATETIGIECNNNFYECDDYEPDMKRYNEIFWIDDFVMDATLKIHANYLCDTIRTYVTEDCTFDELEELGTKARNLPSMKAFYHFEIWFYDINDMVRQVGGYDCYDESKLINIKDKRLAGSVGWAMNAYVYGVYSQEILDWRSTSYAMKTENREGYVLID